MSPLARCIVKLFSKAHKVIYRISGGRLFAKLGEAPMLLLTATGRRSVASREQHPCSTSKTVTALPSWPRLAGPPNIRPGIETWRKTRR